MSKECIGPATVGLTSAHSSKQVGPSLVAAKYPNTVEVELCRGIDDISRHRPTCGGVAVDIEICSDCGELVF